MRLKLDENLPAGLVPLLAALGHEVDTVPAEGIGGEDDDVVWRAAQADGRFLVTQDLDFSDARKYAPGTHLGLLLVRLPQPGRIALQERVASLFRTEAVDTWSGCLVNSDAYEGAGQKARLTIRGAGRCRLDVHVESPAAHVVAGHQRPGARPLFACSGKGCLLQVAVPRPRGCLPAAVREPQDR